MCHNNIIIEHKSFRWIEVATRNGVGLPDKGEYDSLLKLWSNQTIQFAVNRRNSGIRKALSMSSTRQTNR